MIVRNALVIAITAVMVLVWAHGAYAQSSLPWSAITSAEPATNPQQTSNPIIVANTKWASELQTQLVEFFETILRILFLIMAPLLAIAAVALDNTLIYWSILNLDAILWQFWQIMRNFANFALWFLFIRKIFEYIIMSKSTWVDLAKTIKSVVVWAILVQASWFIMAVLIDLSTVGVYGLWAMPLTILKDSKLPIEKASFPVTTTLYNIDAWSSDSLLAAPFAVYYSCKEADKKMIPCNVAKGELVSSDAWKTYKDGYVQTRNNSFKENSQVKINTGDVSDTHCVWLWNIINNKFWDPLSTPQDLNNLRAEQTLTADQWQCPTLPKLIEKWAWITWPLYTLYMSMLGMSSIAVPSTKAAVFEVSIEFLLKMITAIMLILPLVALCIVLLVRIVYLWLYIAISPFLVLWYIFGIKFVEEQKFLKRDNVLWLIFMPVLVTFALSLWVVFLSLVIRSDEWWPQNWKWVLEHLWAILINNEISNEKCYEFMNVFQLCFTSTEREFGAWIGDVMSYIIVNGFAIAIVWFLVFAALKANEITWWIAQSIQSLWEWFIKSVPIFQWVSLGWAQYALNQMPNIGDTMVRKQVTENFDPLFDKWEKWTSSDKKEIDGKMDTVIKDVGKETTQTPTDEQKTKAREIVSAWAHDWTTYDQYANLPQTLAVASGVKSPAQFKTLDAALSDHEVLGTLATTKSNNSKKTLLSSLLTDWNKSSWATQKTYVTRAFNQIQNALDNWVKNDSQKQKKFEYTKWTEPISTYRLSHNNNNMLFMLNKKAKTIYEFALPHNANVKLSAMEKNERENILTQLWWMLKLNFINNSKTLNGITNNTYEKRINEIIWENPAVNITQRTIGDTPKDTKIDIVYWSNTTDSISAITIVGSDGARQQSSSTNTSVADPTQ